MKRRRHKQRQKIEAAPALGGTLILSAEATVELLAADDSGKGKRPTFDISAYNGGILESPGGTVRGGRYVIDLSGVRVSQRIPILLNHDRERIVGQSSSVAITAQTIKVKGAVTGNCDDESCPAGHVVGHARGGFVWGASVGLAVEAGRLESVEAGNSVKVNGRNFQGPLYVVRAGRLGEVSFVGAGADETAEARIAASRGANMDPKFKEWLIASGFDPDAVAANEKQLASLQAAHAASLEAESDDPGDESDEVNADAGDSDLKANREKRAAEEQRVIDIRAAMQEDASEQIPVAIRDGWTVDRAKLVAMQARMPKPLQRAKPDANAPSQSKVLECAIRLGSDEPSARVEKAYDERTLDAAHPLRRMTLKALMDTAIRMDGGTPPSMLAEVSEWVRASFSTGSLTNILSNTANKMMLDAFMAVESAARIVARKLTAKDFKSHTGNRLTGDVVMQKLGPGGEIRSGTVGDTAFTYSIDTYAKMIGLTRQQWINDDLGAFTQIPQRIGWGAALALESAFWTLVIANTGNFFHTSNSNIISGAGSALGVDGLGAAIAKFRRLVDANSNPISSIPKFLVVPPELEQTAEELFQKGSLVATGVTSTSKRSSGDNLYTGRYRPVVTPYLSSAAEWYLLGDPTYVAAFGIAYLNGQESPTVEEVPLDGEYLGRKWRGYLDFGVCQVEKQGGIKSAGS